MSVKINSLELENVKRVRAVALEPSESGLTVIGGANGNGKTSVLDAIAWALGGERMRPDRPDRDGSATPARLHVELSNGLVVERRGKAGALRVTDPNGMRGGQRLLDEFVSQLALDVPRFMEADDRRKSQMLLQALGIGDELARADARVADARQARTEAGREARRLRVAADGMPRHEDAPERAVSVAELMARQQAAMRTNAENQRLRDLAERAHEALGRAKEAVTQAQRRLAEAEAAYEGAAAAEAEAASAASACVDEDVSEVMREMDGAERANQMVRENEAWHRAEDAARAAEAEHEAAARSVAEAEAARMALLDGAELPLEGMGVSEDGRITLGGHSWSDMSGSEQLRVATAVVRATKPECGFVLVDKLEQMDPRTLAEFGEWAEREGLQVIGTRVADDETCTVVIEDGRVRGAGPEEEPEEPRTEWREI